MREEYNKSWKIHISKVILTITGVYMLFALILVCFNPSSIIKLLLMWIPTVILISVIIYYVIWGNINFRNEFITTSKNKGGI